MSVLRQETEIKMQIVMSKLMIDVLYTHVSIYTRIIIRSHF
jgi:hypothetical protein